MATKFKLGEVVRLKSGGPPMTVEDGAYTGFGIPEPRVSAVWFAGAKREHGYFDAETLEKVEPKAPPGE